MWLYTLVGSLVLLRDAPSLNLLALGDETAESLGVDVRRLGRRTLFASSLVVGAVVSITGLIGFVGLVVPHALRRAIGPDVRVLVPASFFAGAALLVACDAASRVAFRALGTVPPVGAVTALLGGPAARPHVKWTSAFAKRANCRSFVTGRLRTRRRPRPRRILAPPPA